MITLEIGDQAVFDQIYQIALAYYGRFFASRHNNVDSTFDYTTRVTLGTQRNLLHWAMLLRQDVNKIIFPLIISGNPQNHATRDKDGLRPLQLACANGHWNLVTKLIARYPAWSRHLSERGKVPKGFSPLHYAAAQGRTDMVEFLLANGADQFAATRMPKEDDDSFFPDHDKTALDLAIQHGHVETAVVLMQASAANIAEKDAKKSKESKESEEAREIKAAQEAAKKARLDEFAKYKVANKKEGDTKDVKDFFARMVELAGKRAGPEQKPIVLALDTFIYNRHNAFQRAAELGNAEMFKALVENCEYFKPDFLTHATGHDSALFTFLKTNNAEMVRYCIRKGVDVNALYSNTTLLYKAVKLGSLDVASMLIYEGAILTTRCDDGDGQEQLIHLAVRNIQNLHFVIGLLETDPGLFYEINKNGQTPLVVAAENCFEMFVALIVHNHALLDEPIANGDTLLHWAVKNRSEKMLDFLIGQEMEINLEDDYAIEALRLAVESGFIEGVKKLIAADVSAVGPKRGRAIHDAVLSGNKVMVDALIQALPSLANKPDADGRTPLHCAVQRGNKNLMVDYLLSKGVTLDAETRVEPGKAGKTPLTLAFDLGHTDIAAQLLVAGASLPKAVAGMEKHPIHKAAKAGDIKLMDLLLSHDASLLELTDAKGRTPLQLSVLNSKDAATQHLIAKGANLNVTSGGRTVLIAAAANGNLPLVQQLLERAQS